MSPLRSSSTEALCHWEAPLLCAFGKVCGLQTPLQHKWFNYSFLNFAGADNVLPPEKEERTELTSAKSLCPPRVYYDFLLKHYLWHSDLGEECVWTNFFFFFFWGCLFSGERWNETRWRCRTKWHKDARKTFPQWNGGSIPAEVAAGNTKLFSSVLKKVEGRGYDEYMWICQKLKNK